MEPNEHGVYEDAERVIVPTPKGIEIELRVAEVKPGIWCAGGRWQAGNGAQSCLPSIHGQTASSRKAALRMQANHYRRRALQDIGRGWGPTHDAAMKQSAEALRTYLSTLEGPAGLFDEDDP